MDFLALPNQELVEMDKAALVLEGGAIRGIYTAGVLDTMLKHELYFKYSVGVSAGAAYGASYISRQIERNLEITSTYTNDPRYMGFKNLVKKGDFFNFDFIFGEIPDHLVPFDYDTYFNSGSKFIVGITNCKTGKCDYFESTKFDKEQLKTALSSTSSMPFVSKMVNFKNELYLDGGIVDSIPYDKAFSDGHEKIVVVLTRNEGYLKKNFKFPSLVKMKYRKFPEFAQAIIDRPSLYNKKIEELEQLEREGKAFIIRPKKSVDVGRMEKDISKIRELYFTACKEMEDTMPLLREWLG